MKKIGFAVTILALGLVGCQTTSEADAKLREKLPGICQAGETGYAVYQAYLAGGGEVSSKKQRAIDVSHDALQSLCADIPNASVAQVLTTSALLAAQLATIGKG